MHRLPSRASLVKFRLAAYLYLAAVILTIGSVGFLGYSILKENQNFIIIASLAVAVSLILMLLQWITAARARCPLCLTPSLSRKTCAKNRQAKRLLGSYRLRTSASIVLKNSFRCPYCNEPTILEVRQRRPH